MSAKNDPIEANGSVLRRENSTRQGGNMDEREINQRFHHPTREASSTTMKYLVRLLLKEIELYSFIAHRFRDDTDDGFHYLELDLKPEVEGSEFDLSVMGDRALIRFVKRVKEPV